MGRPECTHMKPRSPLFRQYLITFVALAALLLLASTAAGLYFSWLDNRAAQAALQQESAEAAAAAIEQRLSEIVHQIGLNVAAGPGEDPVAVRAHEVRLLHQLPAIAEILLLDREGRELLRTSRSGAATAGSKTDYSRSAAFQEAQSGQPYFSPVYYGVDNEPHFTIAMAVGPEQAAVTVAEVDLRFLLAGLGRTAAGGRAVVADARGRVIARADPALQLLKPGPASQPPAESAAHAMVAPLGWRVAIEPPDAAPFASLPELAMRSGLLLLAGLALAVAAAAVLVRRMTAPLRALEESSRRIAQSVLDEAEDAAGGDALAALEGRMRLLAARLRDAQERLERRDEERAAAAQESERACRRLAEMVQALPLAVYQLCETPEGELRFTFVSENVREVLGVGAADILAEKEARWRTTLPEDRIVIEPVLQRAHAARQAVDYYQRVQFDGATRWIRSYTSVPCQTDDGWVWTGCWLDQTQARRREEELRTAREAAESLARTRSAFLANISQEIRTPLNNIIGMSHLALKTGLDSQQAECIGRIHQAGSELFSIINDILDFARIDAGKLAIEAAGFALGHVIDNVAAATGQAAAAKGLTLSFDLPQNLPRQLVGDPLRVEQILVNLVDNAVRFTESGDITVRVERVYSTENQAVLRFVVRDSGIGMTAEQRERLFQVPQPDERSARRQGGIGLGLIICKRLAEMMGGSLAVESRAGAGTTVSFTARFGLTRERAPASGIEGLRVLLVEDNVLNQQVAAEMLADAGAQVEIADNGRIALDKLKSDACYDLVLMDLQMPEMDGFAATAALRSDPAFAELPVLALTAHGTAQDRARCFDAGMNEHLTKPVDPRRLIDALKRWDRRTPEEKIAAARRGAAAPVSRPAEPGRGAPEGRTGKLSKETFQQLAGYLSSGDRLALDCFAAHRAELTAALGAQAAQVEAAIGGRDFDTALSLLDAAMARLDFGFVR